MVQTVNVAALVGVRLDDDERAAVAEIVEALRGPRRPHVTVSDAIRASVRELHAVIGRERAGVAQ